MIYVTTRQKEHEKELNWLDLIEEKVTVSEFAKDGTAGTITRIIPEATPEMLEKINVPAMIELLEDFNKRHENLFSKERKSLYRHFSIPKKTGGLRPIDAPCDELQDALRELANILSNKFGLLYHTAAFAYVEKRNITNALKKHQRNESNWFFKCDVSGFFPSTTLDFTMHMLSMIFPTSEICKNPAGREELKKALSLGFLNGVLPQGSALSP